MPTHPKRGTVFLAAVVALLAGGCGDPQPSTPTTAASPSTTHPTPASTTMGPLTGEEVGWLDGISAMHKEVDKVLTDLPSHLSSTTMLALADHLDGCSHELVRLGPSTQRLAPVFELAKKGCGKYDRAATCFRTAARIGAAITGTAAERDLTDAVKCGFAVTGEGSELLVTAEVKGLEIQNSYR